MVLKATKAAYFDKLKVRSKLWLWEESVGSTNVVQIALA
jgi:hypothetical protein